MDEKKAEGRIFFKLFNTIGIINQLAGTVFEKSLPDGLKISQFAVLNHFVRLGDGATPIRLAHAFQVTKGAMTNTLKRLSDRELITIRPDPDDGRSKRVFITEKGRDTREQCIKNVSPIAAILGQTFTEDEFADALPFLIKLRDTLDDNRDLFLSHIDKSS